MDVDVFGAFTAPTAGNSTTAASPACENSFVQLNLPFFVGATYEWFGPNGFNSTLPNPVINPVTTDDIGEYYAVITLANNCAVMVSDPTFVYVQPTPESPTIVNNGPTCDGSDFVMSVSSPLNYPAGTVFNFDWYFAPTNMLIGSTTDPFFTLNGATPTESGNYYVIMTIGDCCLLYTSPSPRDATLSRMPSSA